jgi:predicted transcriptional regulator
MATQIPSVDEVRQRLNEAAELGLIPELSKKSGVPVTTLSNIRSSGKQGPTVDTLRKFWPHLQRLMNKRAAA